jgi:hypothetical protein
VTEKTDQQPTFVERWFQEQQQWQRTILTYLDTMAKNEEFLVHLGNAMRGSLLAGKPYPSSAPSASSETPQQAAHDDRMDQVLFALHQMQGQLQDLTMTLEQIRDSLPSERKKRSRPGAKTPPIGG